MRNRTQIDQQLVLHQDAVNLPTLYLWCTVQANSVKRIKKKQKNSDLAILKKAKKKQKKQTKKQKKNKQENNKKGEKKWKKTTKKHLESLSLRMSSHFWSLQMKEYASDRDKAPGHMNFG